MRYLCDGEFFLWLEVDARPMNGGYPSEWVQLIQALRLDEKTSPLPFSLRRAPRISSRQFVFRGAVGTTKTLSSL